MNIFENYLLKIEKVIKSAHKDNLLELPDNLSGINVDIPPAKFTGDISTNVAKLSAENERRIERLLLTPVGVRGQLQPGRVCPHGRPNAGADVHRGVLSEERFGADFPIRFV